MIPPWPSWRTRDWLVAATLCALAIAASTFRIVLAPGFELYLGPLFYLLAYRLGGLRLGLAMAFATMLPSWFWWGHGVSIMLAMGQILFIDRIGPFRRSLAIPTLIYCLTISAAVGYVLVRYHYGASDVIVALAGIRKLLNDVMMAALVDLAMALALVDLRANRGSVARLVRLSELLPATITLIVVASAMVLFLGNVERFPRDFATFRAEMALQNELHVRRASTRGEEWAGLQRITTANGTEHEVAFASNPAALTRPAVLERLGCTRVDDGTPVQGPNDRSTFVYWVNACQLASTRVEGVEHAYLYSTRPLAESAYRSVLIDMIGPAIILLLAVLLELFVTRALARSLNAWQQVTDSFGQLDITTPGNLAFSEFNRPIAAIVAANNRFAALVDEREALAEAVNQLKQEMDLSLAADIRFDEAAGTLSFNEISIDRPADARTIVVHPQDLVAFGSAASAAEAMVEFRIRGDDSSEWYFLMARNLAEPGHWRSGWMVRLRQSKLAQHRMLQQARLVELGGMASALSHELKQPLFTISLSAENGRLLIDQGSIESAQRARSKFDRISEQVNRARDIIARISRYARIEDDDPDPVDLIEVVGTALDFMRPLLVQKNVGVRVDFDGPRPLMVLAPRVGVEQILVNAVQNSVDAIQSRRDDGEADLVGEIHVSVVARESGLGISVADNGTGLSGGSADTAFDAFVTTKPADKGTGLGLYISRQIAMEIGGQIAIASRTAPARGAVLTIDLPAFVMVHGERKRAMEPKNAA